MRYNCETCKYNNGKQVVSKGEEPCYSCLTADEVFLKYEAASTNADHIRSMDDVELANFLSGLSMGCVNCPMYYPEENDECVKHCNTAWQEWLKQESVDKGNAE